MLDGFFNMLYGLPQKALGDIFAGFLIFTALYFFIACDAARLWRISSSFRRLCRELDKMKGGICDAKELDSLFFEEKTYKPVKDLWMSFCEDWHRLRQSGKTPDIAVYFNENNAINIPAGRKKAEMVPRILIMTGIAGTLIGLASGLRETGFAASGNAAVSSFNISIAAIAVSIVFQLMDRLIYQSAVMHLKDFVNLVGRKLPAANEAMNLELLIQEQRALNRGLQSLAENISSRLSEFVGENMVPSLNKAFEDAVVNRVIPPVRAVTGMLQQISHITLETQKKGMRVLADHFLERLNSTMGSQFKKLGGSIRELLERQVQTERVISRLLEELAKQAALQKSVNEETGALLSTLKEHQSLMVNIGAALAGNIEKITMLNEELNRVADIGKTALEELRTQRMAWQEESRQYGEMMGSQVDRLMEELTLQLDSAFARFNDITDAALNKMANTMESAHESMVSNMKQLFERMDDHVRDISLYAKELTEEVRQLNSRLESSVKEFGLQMNSGVKNTLDIFDRGLSEICSRFGRVIGDMRDAVEELPGIIAGLKSASADRGMKEQ